jgi:ribosomal-protein-serine acetyltransferase
MKHDYRSLILAAGEKFRLIPFDVSFSESLVEAIEESRDELACWTNWYHADYSPQVSRSWLEGRERSRFEGHSYDFAVTDAGTGDLVGGCTIDRIQADCRLGNVWYWTRSSRTNEGAASAATAALASFGLARLHLVRLEIVVPEANFRAQRVAEKIGALREARLKNRMIINEELQAAYLFSLLGSIEKPEPEPDPNWVKVKV